MNICRKQLRAFTIVELLVVIAIIGILAAIQIPTLANTKANVQRVYCSGNLKRVGIAFRIWSDKNGGRMPMAVPYTQGGASSAVGFRANGANFAANMSPVTGPRGVFGMFCVMSNELSTPKILFCPSDGRSAYFQGTIFGNSGPTNSGCYSDFQVSYFVGVDANDTAPNMLLSGDAHLGDTATPPVGSNVYGESSSVRKFVSGGTNTTWSASSPGWADKTHSMQGNVAFADGSVQNLNTAQFRSALNKTDDRGRTAGVFSMAVGSLGSGVNRLQFP